MVAQVVRPLKPTGADPGSPVSVRSWSHDRADRSPTMRLPEASARDLLGANLHGVLCTVHPERGVDAVPVVYVADPDGWVAVPIDRVKPKSAGTLQRERNLERDARATLLVEHWDRDDWSQLWWVRAELRWTGADVDVHLTDRLASRLAADVTQYRDRPFDRMLLFRVVGVTGWSADDGL